MTWHLAVIGVDIDGEGLQLVYLLSEMLLRVSPLIDNLAEYTQPDRLRFLFHINNELAAYACTGVSMS